MASLQSWAYLLKGHLCTQTVSRPQLSMIRQVQFLRYWAGEKQHGPDTLWVGAPQELAALLEQEQGLEGLSFFSAGRAPGLVPLAAARQVNLLETDLELLDLYETLAGPLRRHHSWATRLLKNAAGSEALQKMVDTIAAAMGGAVFVLNAEYHVTCASEQVDMGGPAARELSRRQGLSPRQAAELLQPVQDEGEAVSCRVMDSGVRCYIRRVYKARRKTFTVLLFAPPGHLPLDAAVLLELLWEYARPLLESAEDAISPAADFRVLLEMVVASGLTDEEELRRRFARLPRPPQTFCGFVIIEAAVPGGLPLSSPALLAQLEQLFPGSNIAPYDGALVILISRPDRSFQPTPAFDRAHFQEILEHHDAFAAISNATSRRAMLRTLYLLTKSVLQMGPSLRANSRDRIFLFEEYAEYVAIDLCINSFSALLGHDDIIYLTHPDTVTLYRYDLINKTNLLDVLYYYCLNNCSISRGAHAAYMHRNTFSNHLSKVQEILKTDLSNGEIQRRIIFSYKILRYYDRYAKINLDKRLSASALAQKLEG